MKALRKTVRKTNEADEYFEKLPVNIKTFVF